MLKYLDFKDARCKDCYKCLRECPVKAIEISDHHAKIIKDRCILCGHCTKICPQNAKVVHTEKDGVAKLLSGKNKVVASVAPSFVSSFKSQNFADIADALRKLGFDYAEETAVGAKVVTEEYIKLLKTNTFKNFITSACPAVNRMIQLYHHDALKYLAPVDTPMIAHAKILKKRFPDADVVFIGPCIAKKREAEESGLIKAVLTFDDFNALLEEKGVTLGQSAVNETDGACNKARYYPISRGIIKSFPDYPENYEYVAVDGVERVNEVLENIESFSGLFLELNCCEYACVNGPCAIKNEGGSVKANEDVRNYTLKSVGFKPVEVDGNGISFDCKHKPLHTPERDPSEDEIKEILAKIGKTEKADELNCGACGYNTCREKAWAVANGYAHIDMCVPYMRERAESMSFEIIQNSPNGIILLDKEFKIQEINRKAKELWGITDPKVEGGNAFDYINPTEFILASNENKNVYGKKIYIDKTDKYAELTIVLLHNQDVLFGVVKDITEQMRSEEKLNSIKYKTLETTDEVIKKQMRVAQEIASLLGETTAETKVALLKLKKTLTEKSEDRI